MHIIATNRTEFNDNRTPLWTPFLNGSGQVTKASHNLTTSWLYPFWMPTVNRDLASLTNHNGSKFLS